MDGSAGPFGMYRVSDQSLRNSAPLVHVLGSAGSASAWPIRQVWARVRYALFRRIRLGAPHRSQDHDARRLFRSDRMRLRQAGSLVLVAVLAACVGAGEQELRNGARSLVPRSSVIVAEEAGDCVELAPSPSCVQVYFVMEEIDLKARGDSVVRTSRAAGWVLDSRETFPGGMDLRLHTAALTAFVSLSDIDQARACMAEPSRRCADVVIVEGIYSR